MTTTRPLRPLSGTPRGADGAPAELRFAVVGDAQPLLPRLPLSQVTGQIVRELRLLQPDLVLYTGDRIWGFRHSRQEMLNEYDRFRALTETTGVPWYSVPGNHEIQSDPSARAIFLEQGQLAYGSFDVGPYHFVALDTEEIAREWRVTGRQLQWLRGDLRRNRDAKAIFVFMHRPLFSWFQWEFDPDDSAILQGLFRGHPVKAVFAGHDHLFYEEEHDGITYATTGGGGGSLYAQPQRGGFAHYLLVTVRDGEVEIDVVEPHHLEVVYVAGNDGFEPVSRARVANTTDRRLVARNLEFRVPRLSRRDAYVAATQGEDWDGAAVDQAAVVRRVEDNGDGSVTLGLEVELPPAVAFTVTVEAYPPEARRSA